MVKYVRRRSHGRPTIVTLKRHVPGERLKVRGNAARHCRIGRKSIEVRGNMGAVVVLRTRQRKGGLWLSRKTDFTTGRSYLRVLTERRVNGPTREPKKVELKVLKPFVEFLAEEWGWGFLRSMDAFKQG